MIKCYCCPLQDLCPTLKELMHLHPGKFPSNAASTLPEDCRKQCPLYIAANEASKQIPELTKGKKW